MKLKKSLKLIRFTLLFALCFDAFSATKIEEIFKEKSEIEDPMSLRDPFFAPKIRGKKTQRIKGKIGKGYYSNIPKIGNVVLEKLRIIGVVVGPNRRAFAKVSESAEHSDKTYVLKEGMKLGQSRAVLKAILPGGIVLVEKNTNIYGEDEYLETVIPISK